MLYLPRPAVPYHCNFSLLPASTFPLSVFITHKPESSFKNIIQITSSFYTKGSISQLTLRRPTIPYKTCCLYPCPHLTQSVSATLTTSKCRSWFFIVLVFPLPYTCNFLLPDILRVCPSFPSGLYGYTPLSAQPNVQYEVRTHHPRPPLFPLILFYISAQDSSEFYMPCIYLLLCLLSVFPLYDINP